MIKKITLALLALAIMQSAVAMEIKPAIEVNATAQEELDNSLRKEAEMIHWGKNLKKIRELLLAGANPNIRAGREGKGNPILMIAINNWSVELCELLIANKANVNVKEEYWGCTPLMWAAQGSPLPKDTHISIKMCEMLLKNGANVHAKSDTGSTAWEVAKRNNQPSICELLEKYGAEKIDDQQDDND